MHPRIPSIPNIRQLTFSLLLVFLIMPLAATAQTDDDSDADPNELDLFDNDREVTPLGWSRLYLSAGVMRLSADGRFQIGIDDGPTIPVINLDRLGVDSDDNSYWLSLKWRSRSSRWGAWFAAWEYSASGQRVWQTSLPILDIPVGASLETEMTATWYIAEATYSFVRTKTVDFGAGFGFHIVDLDTSLRGRVVLGEREGEVISESLSTLAPLPNLLGHVHWKMAPDWQFIARAGWFGLNYDEYDGQMTNLHAILRWNFARRWGVDLGYQFVNLDLDIDEDGYTEIYDVDFDGPMLSLQFNF